MVLNPDNRCLLIDRLKFAAHVILIAAAVVFNHRGD